MSKTKPAEATPNQAYALSLAVYAAYRAGWNGDIRKRSTRPSLRPGQRWFKERGGGQMMPGPNYSKAGYLITHQTFQALVSKRFVDGANGRLTMEGIVVAEEKFEDLHGRTAEQAANAHMLEAQEKEQQIQDKIARAKHLFRGFKISRSFSGSKKIADQITRNGLPPNLFFLDDLITFGEEIEKLR